MELGKSYADAAMLLGIEAELIAALLSLTTYSNSLAKKNKTMKTSNVGIQLIQEFESLHDGDLTMIGLQPKMDPIGIWTEGYGHAMRDSKIF
jgi:hypothetical protein